MIKSGNTDEKCPVSQSHKFNFKGFILAHFRAAWLTTPHTKEWAAIEANHAELKGVVEEKLLMRSSTVRDKQYYSTLRGSIFSSQSSKENFTLEILLKNPYYTACIKEVM